MKDYKPELEQVRNDFSLLENYRYITSSDNNKQAERSALALAIYYDLKPSDFEIVEFLLEQEYQLRKSATPGDVDELYFIAFVATMFNRVEIIWLFLKIKNIDFDSGIGFDGQYIFFMGVDATYKYAKSLENPEKTKLLKELDFWYYPDDHTDEAIAEWKHDKLVYFGLITEEKHQDNRVDVDEDDVKDIVSYPVDDDDLPLEEEKEYWDYNDELLPDTKGKTWWQKLLGL
ncbi:MAG: hypothetical protein M0D57_00420 [Sphingobacteriales bacterium JAD_PAG50586_3]|nr:MAG: hypothetical protein M0D57_00420 [Sphingobacteriales bacterium JAD_PAG50586_3]